MSIPWTIHYIGKGIVSSHAPLLMVVGKDEDEANNGAPFDGRVKCSASFASLSSHFTSTQRRNVAAPEGNGARNNSVEEI